MVPFSFTINRPGSTDNEFVAKNAGIVERVAMGQAKVLRANPSLIEILDAYRLCSQLSRPREFLYTPTHPQNHPPIPAATSSGWPRPGLRLFVLIPPSSSPWQRRPENEPGPYDLVIAGGRCVDPQTGLHAVRNVGINDGRIAAISKEKLEGKKKVCPRLRFAQ